MQPAPSAFSKLNLNSTEAFIFYSLSASCATDSLVHPFWGRAVGGGVGPTTHSHPMFSSLS